MFVVGIYFQVTTSRGKKYTYRRCARCRVEDVQRCVARKAA
jgi:hypothetical protein